MRSPTAARRRRAVRRTFVAVAITAMVATVVPATASAQELPTTDDPRFGLTGGFNDAQEAALGFQHVGRFNKADGSFFNPSAIGSISFANSDVAFTTDEDGKDHVIQGNWRGFQIFDVSDPENPTLRTEVLCPGGQGDANVHGNLLFTSVEEATAKIDCTTGGVTAANRMRGVRIWDISDLDAPVQVATIQTCRGSHTNRLVEDPNDPDHVYIYNNGTSGQRSPAEFVHTPQGFVNNRCGQTSATGPNPSQWMIEVIKVPVANPAAAAVVTEARLFQDVESGAVNGLQNSAPPGGHPCASVPNPLTGAPNSCSPAGTTYSPSPITNTCHDITAYPEIGLAAGACQGNGLLIDISTPANPVRVDAVADPNFAYWHSANFNNDGTAVMFTDEWGGGTGARCAPAHRLEWGANAMFSIDRSGATPKLVFETYNKLPVAQNTNENCVAHQANIVPVPGRDILVQGWYQGGISMLDWTDPANPFEIGYFDRGPVASGLTLGGFWNGYWFNGNVYGSEIARGLDAFELTATDALSANEIAAAKTVQLDEHNAMSMRRITWEPSFEVARALTDQAERAGLETNHVNNVRKFVDRAERFQSGPQARAAVANLKAVANQVRRDAPALADALDDLSGSLG
jgi:hypothetical protein